PDNKKNLPHFRLGTLQAVDSVDDPAANPNGLFHRADKVAVEAEQLLAWGLGLSDKRPQLAALNLDVDPDRLAGFVQRFLTRHKLTITPHGKGTVMPKFKSSFATQLSSRGKKLKADCLDDDQKSKDELDDETDKDLEDGDEGTKNREKEDAEKTADLDD